MGNELIKFKGTVDGVKIYLDSDGDFFEIFTSLYEKLNEFRDFFGEGHCNIYFVGRDLTASDKLRLESVVSAMLPESSIVYGDRKVIRSEEDLEKTLDFSDLAKKKEAEQNSTIDEFEDIKAVAEANFKSSRARYFEGVVKNGKTVEADGHLILMGDVEEGGKLVAGGNVIVMGSLKGSVVAGKMCNEKAYIMALGFEPAEIRIARLRRVFDKNEHDLENKSKKAYLINNQICVDDFLVKL